MSRRLVSLMFAATVATPAIAAPPHWSTKLVPAVSLAGTPDQHFNLSDRMRHYHVPAASVAVVDQCRIAETYAQGSASDGKRITNATRFQAASVSKAVTAVAALRLVEQGKLSLDSDVRSAVAAWTAGAASPGPLTLRQLLSHTAGVSVHGFEGYRRGGPIPSLEQILSGEPPANNKPIRIEVKPGTNFSYSGGGYTLVQALMADRTGKAFPTLLRDQLLRPLHMDHSAFGTLPRRSSVAIGHDKSGSPVPGGWNVYPELAAAGLWSTPTDLAKFTIAVMRSARGDSAGAILQPKTAREMLTRQKPGPWGLGFELRDEEGEQAFLHTGENQGYLGVLLGMPKRCSGIVVMVNGDGGAGLMKEIVRAVADERGWPQFVEAVRLTPLDSTESAQLKGHYSVKEPAVAFDIMVGASGGLELFMGATSKGRIVTDSSGRLLVVGNALNPVAALKSNPDATLTVLLGGRSYLARRN